MSKYYLDLTNFSTGYGKLSRRAAKALDEGDIEKSGHSLARLHQKIIRRKSRDPQFNKGTRLQMEKLEDSIDKPFDKFSKNPGKQGLISGYMMGRYPKLMKQSHDSME